jgi:hypothetical protein
MKWTCPNDLIQGTGEHHGAAGRSAPLDVDGSLTSVMISAVASRTVPAARSTASTWATFVYSPAVIACTIASRSAWSGSRHRPGRPLAHSRTSSFFCGPSDKSSGSRRPIRNEPWTHRISTGRLCFSDLSEGELGSALCRMSCPHFAEVPATRPAQLQRRFRAMLDKALAYEYCKDNG